MKPVLPDRILAPRLPPSGSDSAGVVVTRALHWPGVMLEAGHDNVSIGDGRALTHHYLSLHADDLPYTFEVKVENRFRRFVIPPQGLFIWPANESITTSPSRPHASVRLAIEPMRFHRLLGQQPDAAEPIGLRCGYSIDAPEIALLLRALVAEADGGAPAGLPFVEAVISAIARKVVRHVGQAPAPRDPPRGRLSPGAMRRVLELMDTRLDAKLTVESLAREAGLSVAHFARAFRETTGRSPHQYLLTQRLERARRLLERPGVTLSLVAQLTGFADQAHLSRLFKREYGVTPGVFLRSHRR